MFRIQYHSFPDNDSFSTFIPRLPLFLLDLIFCHSPDPPILATDFLYCFDVFVCLFMKQKYMLNEITKQHTYCLSGILIQFWTIRNFGHLTVPGPGHLTVPGCKSRAAFLVVAFLWTRDAWAIMTNIGQPAEIITVISHNGMYEQLYPRIQRMRLLMIARILANLC